MKTGAVLRAQFNGLPETFPRYDTWSGVRFSAAQLVEFTRQRDFQMLALEGSSTQYMWTTWIKREAGWRDRLRHERPEPRVRVRKITNAHNSEPGAPSRGRFASVSIWVDGLPPECDLYDLEVSMNGIRATATYIGPPDHAGAQQINVILPELDVTGLIPVELRWFGERLCDDATLRVIPAGPQIPTIISITDGIDYLSGTRIVTRSVKASIEEVRYADEFEATIDGLRATDLEAFCTDPLTQRFEFNFKLPEEIGPGVHTLAMSLGRRRFAPVVIEVA